MTGPNGSSRRTFFKTTAAAGTLAARQLARPCTRPAATTWKVGLIGCGGRGRGAAENICEAAGTSYSIKIHALGDAFEDRIRDCLELPRRAPSRARAGSTSATASSSARRLPEGHRLLRPGDPGHAARFPAATPRGRRQGRQAHLHREARGRRRHRHPQGPGRLRGGEDRRTWPSSPAPSAATRSPTSRA